MVEATMTLSPTARGPLPARLDVDSAGETVGDTEPLRRSARLPAGLEAAPTLDCRLRLEIVSAATTDCFRDSLFSREKTPWLGAQLK